MGETKKRIKTYKLRYICDKCGKGDMKWARYNEQQSNRIFKPVNECEVCGFVAVLDKCYPATIQEEDK